jgi:hypothetical protein
MGEIMSKHMNM